MEEKISYERYQRQIILKDFGEEGQQKLMKAKVLMIGAGGLGCPVLQYLAAAGVGTIGIVDDDTVALSNLHRQPLYSVADIGLSKAEKATEVLQKLNPEISIVPFNQPLTVENALEILQSFDIIIDGTDNFPTRYMINDACVLLNKPLVYGAISKFEGQVSIFNCRQNNNDEPANYRDLFPEPPKDDEVLNCAETGVLGVLPGIIGTMMASETIKLITGLGTPLINHLLTFNALNNQSYNLQLFSREETIQLIPANEKSFKQMDYEWLCSSTLGSFEIDISEFDNLLPKENIAIIDVREEKEMPEVTEFIHMKIPLNQITTSINKIKQGNIIVFCQSGKRSKQAAVLLSGIFGTTKKIYSLKGGIESWKRQHQIIQPDNKPKNIFVEGPIAPSFIGESIQKHNSKTNIGGHSIFLGQVRADIIADKKVAFIEYTAYEEMALEKMHIIRENIFEKYELTCMHVYHSLGKVAAGEISLFVFTSSAHRKPAIDACQETVERLKAELPVWGKELFEDETYHWKENK